MVFIMKEEICGTQSPTEISSDAVWSSLNYKWTGSWTVAEEGNSSQVADPLGLKVRVNFPAETTEERPATTTGARLSVAVAHTGRIC